ncbi:hypothetical protein QUF74_08950 [Candidatus Halobeggiatoa sp. HSG11]|nr:hypothetical protein [Candidatus Halobeggiatoa sp. HSG11]
MFFVITTFLSYLTYEDEFQRIFDVNIHRVLVLLDLRKENTVGTWFSSILFLITGLSFVLLGWSSNFKIANWQRLIFKLTAIGAVLLSADEVASIHETVGKWLKRAAEDLINFLPIDNKGFIWVVLFAPIAIAGLIATVIALHKVIATTSVSKQMATWALWLAVLCLPMVFIFEMLEWYLYSKQQHIGSLSCWEEMFELLGMYSLFTCAVLIAGRHKL